MKTIIGIDNGTQSTKVIFYDIESKTIVGTGKAPHDLISGDNGRREQKAQWWIEALDKAFSQIPENIRSTAIAVGVSGQQHGFVPLDDQGNPLYNVKLWNDTETAEECQIITKNFGGKDKLIAQVGNPILPGFTAPKVLWLKRNHPEAYKKLAHILLPHDYLNYYLTGEFYTEAGDASGTAYFNVYTKEWAPEVLKAIDPDRDLLSTLPSILESHKMGGTVTEAAAAQFGIPAGIPVSTGGGDNMMGAIGTGAVSEGVLTVSLGTSGTIYSFRETPMIDAEERLSAFCSSTGGWLPLLCTMNCTVATELIRDLLKKEVSQIDSLIESIPPGSEGLTILPFFNGERTPNLPNGKGSIFGLNGTNLTEGHLLKAAMEAAAYGLKLGLEAFEELGLKPSGVHLIGGGSNSSQWRQIFADVFEVPVECPDASEAAALGGALQALWALEGGKTSMADICKEHIALDPSKKTLPNKDQAEAYRKAYSEYTKYIKLVTPLYQ